MNEFSKAEFLSRNYADKVYRNTGNSALLHCIPTASKTILDVGCGAGDNARKLKARGCHVTGFTASNAEAAIAKEFCDDIVVGDVEGDIGFLENERFEVILLSHILEHLISPERALANLAGLLSHNGRIYVAVPNMAFWRLRVQMLKGDWSRAESGPFDRTHLHFWSFQTATQIASQSGLELEAHVPGDLACPLWPLRALAPQLSNSIDKMLGPYFPNLFATQTLLIIKPKSCA